ncbi:hypothetical protein C8R46DRAFT_916588, partial [Mycena filopes]
PSRVLSQVHNICDAGEGPCYEELRKSAAYVARISGVPPVGPPLPRTQETYPMSASCLVCNNEASESRKSLKKCARCELTRYCSVDCQRQDWKRHKDCCKVVKEVKWVWN